MKENNKKNIFIIKIKRKNNFFKYKIIFNLIKKPHIFIFKLKKKKTIKRKRLKNFCNYLYENILVLI